jgi:hypothetical protein
VNSKPLSSFSKVLSLETSICLPSVLRTQLKLWLSCHHFSRHLFQTGKGFKEDKVNDLSSHLNHTREGLFRAAGVFERVNEQSGQIDQTDNR